ncbi:glycoside hydrolase family 43 protein [Ceratobasidium sp. AG-Ba]|nr:glycoside hydrolase family 43 protein [Ceratobasidium sp. AG-Ba]
MLWDHARQAMCGLTALKGIKTYALKNIAGNIIMRLLLTLAILCFNYICILAFTNPLKSDHGADPFMVYSDGYYYLLTTTANDVQIRRASTLGGLKTGIQKVVWKDSAPDRCCNVWAPEIHNMDGTWYIYYTAGRSGNQAIDTQRMHAVKGSSSDIWASTWSYAGRLVVPNRDTRGIDGTVMTLSSGKYWLYSSYDGDEQCLWIAKMNGPLSLENGYKISAPTNPWERIKRNINEGPAPITHNGRTWIIYSASSCETKNYSLASLELVGSDPLQMSSWKKSSGPIFNSTNGSWGPGHNGFFYSPTGAPWMVYHASPTSYSGCDDTRRTMAQRIGYHSDGSLNLGQPRPLSENIPEPV